MGGRRRWFYFRFRLMVFMLIYLFVIDLYGVFLGGGFGVVCGEVFSFG